MKHIRKLIVHKTSLSGCKNLDGENLANIGQSPKFPVTKVSLYTVLSSFMLILAFFASISELQKLFQLKFCTVLKIRTKVIMAYSSHDYIDK